MILHFTTIKLVVLEITPALSVLFITFPRATRWGFFIVAHAYVGGIIILILFLARN